MLNLVRTLIAPLLSITFVMISNGFFITFLSVRLKVDGYSESIIGYVHSAYYAGLLLGAWRFETLLYRVGHIRSFAAAAAIATATMLAQGIVLHPAFWIFMRFLNGIATASIFIVIESWLLAKSTITTRGRVLSLYMIGLYASQTAGQFIIDMIDINTRTSFIVAGMLCSLSTVPLALTYTKSPESEAPAMKNLLSLFRVSPFGVIGCVLGGMILSSIYSFVPNFAQTFGLSVAWVTSTTIAGGFILQWPIGHLSDIFDRRKLLILSSLAIVIPCLGIILLPKTLLIVCLLSFILGGLCFTIYPISITHVCDRVGHNEIVSTTAVLMLAYSVGAVIGPLIAPFSMKLFSTPGLYVYIASCASVLALFGIYSYFRKPSIPMEEQANYVALPSMTTVAYELDPRILNEEEEQTAELR